jgi:anaerobic magnesium-protoporphyrin IX monomethyl ester cyclase
VRFENPDNSELVSLPVVDDRIARRRDVRPDTTLRCVSEREITMKILMLQPPSPPHMNVKRDYAGGMGVADPSDRLTFGHDAGYVTLPYMSLLYTTGVMERAGHEVRFLDAQADNLDIERVLRHVREFQPDIVVGVLNLPSLYGDLEVLKAVRAGLPGLRTVAIGSVAMPLFDFVAASGAADAIVRGDAEVVLPEMAEALVRGGREDLFERKGNVLTNRRVMHVENLNALPPMPYHLVPVEKYRYHGFGENVRYAALFASRGCSYACYYCPYPMGFGGSIVHRDPIQVVEEIEQLYRAHNVRAILFRDQVFTMDWEKTTRLCDEIIRRGLKIQWVVETRLDRVNEPLLSKMKEAGCVRIHFGLESGDPQLFSSVGKDAAGGSMEQLIANFLITEKVGIHPHMFVLIGLLGETWGTIRRTIETIKRIKPLTLQVSIVTPYPGTKLYDVAREKGLIESSDWSQYTGFKAVMHSEALSSADLGAARALMHAEHRRAVRWKQVSHNLRRGLRYALDGSLPGRIARRWRKGRAVSSDQ